MDKEIKDFLTTAVNSVYKDLEITNYKFDIDKERYDIDMLHTTTERQIRIGFRDASKRRDFDVIPLQVQNAPLGLIEIITTFLKVFWHANEKDQTITEALVELAQEEMLNKFDSDTDDEEEKLVQ